ncbi:MAG: hypothetical protein WCP20_22190 [Desulfuromonadales bacterium]
MYTVIPVIVAVSADKPDIDDAEAVIYRYNQTIVVPLYIENDTIVCDDTAVAVTRT